MKGGALAATRGVFAFATLVILFVALTPREDHPASLTPWDKADHVVAFYVLSLLALAAFPRTAPLLLAAALSALGAAIEVVQATPQINRDADVLDWVADTAAVAAAMAPLALAGWRASVGPTEAAGGSTAAPD